MAARISARRPSARAASVGQAQPAADLGVLGADPEEHRPDQDGLRPFPVRPAPGRLERLVRRRGKTVQVQAVVPVGLADQGQPVGAAILHHVIEGAAQVLRERARHPGVALVRHHFVENRPVPGLLEVGRRGQDQPERVVVEPAADLVVSLLREGLVLMVGAAVLKEGRGEVEQARARARAGI